MPAHVRHAAGDGRWGDRRRLPGAREEQRGRRGRRERRDGRDGPGACDARGLRPRHRGERHDAVRPRGPVPRAARRRGDGARLVLRSPAGAGRDVRRPRAPEGRARSPDGVDSHEGRYRHEARPQHALHRRDDPARPRVWQPHGGPDGALRQAAGPRGADRDGMLQRGPRGGARCDRSGRRECEAGDRDGASRSAEGGGGAPPGGGRRVRAQGGGRPAAGLAVVTAALAVGLMSGTSVDGVSTALVRLSDDPLAAQLVAFRQEPYTTPERGQIIDAIARGGSKDLALLHVALGERFAGAVLQLLAQAKVAPRDLSFIASHGQTIWHEPGRATLQLGDPAVIAERVGVRVVSDFRSRDVAAGGQGAPLVPVADVMLFGHPERGRLLLNLGGMANITWVRRRGVIDGAVAFDTGPGVAVIDAVTRRVDPDAGYDQDGERARRGHPDLKALHQLLTDPFFDQPPPKSTGRERFGIEFADRLIALVQGAGGSANDAVATATALTAETVARGMERWTPPLPPGAGDELVISGGGARNPALVELLAGRVRPRPVVPFDQLFFDGEAKEALAFAFLGFLTLAGKPGNLPAATGARGPRVLGSVTPA